MKKKTFIIAAAVFLLGCIGTLQAFTHLETQEPQEIRGIVVDEYDAAWYEQQQTLCSHETVDWPQANGGGREGKGILSDCGIPEHQKNIHEASWRTL